MPDWLALTGAGGAALGAVLLLWSRVFRPVIRFLYIMERATPILESMVRHFDKSLPGDGNGGSGFDLFMDELDQREERLETVEEHEAGDIGHPPAD